MSYREEEEEEEEHRGIKKRAGVRTTANGRPQTYLLPYMIITNEYVIT